MKALLICHLIRNLSNHKQQTMTEFAGSINISQSALSKIENGTQEASITIFESVCDICRIPMYDFFKMLDEKIEVNIDTYIKDPALEQYKIKQELHALIYTMTDDQQKALYVFLLPYEKITFPTNPPINVIYSNSAELLLFLFKKSKEK